MKALNIKWDIDIEEAYATLDDMTSKRAAEVLGIPVEIYNNMTTEERHDYAYDYFKKSPSSLAELCGVPVEADIPAEIAEDPEYVGDREGLVEHISDWLSDEYGYCHEGFGLDTDIPDNLVSLSHKDFTEYGWKKILDKLGVSDEDKEGWISSIEFMLDKSSVKVIKPNSAIAWKQVEEIVKGIYGDRAELTYDDRQKGYWIRTGNSSTFYNETKLIELGNRQRTA